MKGGEKKLSHQVVKVGLGEFDDFAAGDARHSARGDAGEHRRHHNRREKSLG